MERCCSFLQRFKIANHTLYFLSVILLTSIQVKRVLLVTNGTQTGCCLSLIARLSRLSRC